MNRKKQLIIIGIIILVFVYLGTREIVRYRGHVAGLESLVTELNEENLKLRNLFETDLEMNLETELNKKLFLLRLEMTKLKPDSEDLRRRTDELIKLVALQSLPDVYTLSELNEIGIDNYKIIEDDLIALGDNIIDSNGVLGGTMQFYNVNIFSYNYAIGYFSDGHISGYGIYKFTVNEIGDLVWGVVIEFLDI